MTAEIANSTMATKKISLAISIAVPAMPPKPNTAATRATIRKVTAHPSMALPPESSYSATCRAQLNNAASKVRVPCRRNHYRARHGRRDLDSLADARPQLAARVPERNISGGVGPRLFGGLPMTRIVALRASIIFVTLTLLTGGISLGSHATVLTALLLISASVGMLLFVLALAPAHAAPIPVRVRDRRIGR